MGKRKREVIENEQFANYPGTDAKKKKVQSGQDQVVADSTTLQIVVGTYEKILHGIQASISKKARGSFEVQFADTFLLSPHGAAIRCLAISPPSTSGSSKSQKAILASGSSDQVINLYQISREAPARSSDSTQKGFALTKNQLARTPKNTELGSLQHHNGSVNALYFPIRSKLLSAAEDSTISIARTRDWTVLSTIKAPIPKARGRPSGDTAALGDTPAGINDVAIHPSMKLMVSVGKGEKCMRLWNLVTGKKAGVLNFEKDLLQGVGEGRWASGEGRRVVWNSTGEEFVVGFERGCVVFGMDCQPRCRIAPSPATKVHQLHYTNISNDNDRSVEILAVSTDDSRIIFYTTDTHHISDEAADAERSPVPWCKAIGQLGGVSLGLIGRVKDFEILRPPDSKLFFVVSGSSDGAIRLWVIRQAEFRGKSLQDGRSRVDEKGDIVNGDTSTASSAQATLKSILQIGELLGTYKAGNRITCLKAFVMSPPESPKAVDVLHTVNSNGNKGTSSEDEIDINL